MGVMIPNKVPRFLWPMVYITEFANLGTVTYKQLVTNLLLIYIV